MPSTDTESRQFKMLRSWYEEYRRNLTVSPLEDIRSVGVQLDITEARSEAIEQLFSRGVTTLNSLFPDKSELLAATHKIVKIDDDNNNKKRAYGIADFSLAVGVAHWENHAMPVLVYPMALEREQTMAGEVIRLRIVGKVKLNPSLIFSLAHKGCYLKEEELFNGENYEQGTPQTSLVFRRIVVLAQKSYEDFTIDKTLVLGSFSHPDTYLVQEGNFLVQAVKDERKISPAFDSLIEILQGEEQKNTHSSSLLDSFTNFDEDPHKEYAINDVDNIVRHIANAAVSDNSLCVNITDGNDSAQVAASIASECAFKEKSVLYVPAILSQKQRFIRSLHDGGIQNSFMEVSADQKVIDQRLIEAVEYQHRKSTERYDQLADELMGVRSRLTRYLAEIHGINKKWGYSAYQVMQELAKIASQQHKPTTRVRLSLACAHYVAKDVNYWAQKLYDAAQLGEFTLQPYDTPWYHASLFSEEEAVKAYQTVVHILQDILPKTRQHVAQTVQTCGFPIPKTVQEWSRQVLVLKNLRRVLDVFQPEIFERDINALIEATLPKQLRKEYGSSMGFWARRRHVKEANGLLRVGAHVEDLHEALKVVARQAEQWYALVPHGGWPVLPAKLGSIIETQDAFINDITVLETVLSTTPQGGNLMITPIEELEERLKELYDDHKALDTLTQRSRLEQEFDKAGLGELVEDLKKRSVDDDSVSDEFRLAWWTTIFDDIISSHAISHYQDSQVLPTTAERFAQVDKEHIASIGSMIEQETMRRLKEYLFSHAQEANQLHTLLASSAQVSIHSILRDYNELIKLAYPICIASPTSLAALTDPQQLFDVVIVDACSHMSSLEMLTLAARARNVVILCNCTVATSPVIKQYIEHLPIISLQSRSRRRSLALNSFLTQSGFSSINSFIPQELARGNVRFHSISAVGIPVISTGLVESSQAEIDKIIEIISQRSTSFTVIPKDYILAVVTLTQTLKNRLGTALKALALKNRSMAQFLRHVRLVYIDDIEGVRATDSIISLCFAKTSHGRLLHQFGSIEGESGASLLLQACALADRHCDVVSAFTSQDLEDERLHKPGARLLKKFLVWLESHKEDDSLLCNQLSEKNREKSSDVLLKDLAMRLEARGLCVALQYGFSTDKTIPLVVGVPHKPFTIAIVTDNTGFMTIPSTRYRHRLLKSELVSLGWTVMNVWSTSCFIDPEKEVERIVSRIGELYGNVS